LFVGGVKFFLRQPSVLLFRFYSTTPNKYIMKALIFKIPLISLLFLVSSSFGQKNKTWNQVKSAELTQPFGYVWNYINSPDVSHKKCKGHEHSTHEQIKPKKSPSLKTSFVVENSLFKLGYSNVSKTINTKTVIFYRLLNDKGNELKSKTNITFDNTLEKKWDTTTIDLSAYKDQTITIVVGIQAQEENSSLLINLFQ
jgi:hypothetical protein